MLDVNNDTYLITHAYDMLIGAGYFFFLITIGQKVFGYVLPKFKPSLKSNDQNVLNDMSVNPMWGLAKKENRIPMLKALGLSVGIFAIAGSTTLFTPEKNQMIVVILLITTLGIYFHCLHLLIKLKNTFELGMYFILVFSIDVASMVDLTNIANASPTIFYYVFLVVLAHYFYRFFSRYFSKLILIL